MTRWPNECILRQRIRGRYDSEPGALNNVRLPRRSLDVFLWTIAIVSLAVLFLSHEDPFVRDALCAGTGFCPTFAGACSWPAIFM